MHNFVFSVITNGNDGLSNDSTVVGNCYKSTSELLPIILLAALLLVVIMMTFCFCRRLTKGLVRKKASPIWLINDNSLP